MDLTRRDLLALGGLTLAGTVLAPARGRAATPKRGGTFRFRGYTPPHFDPHLTASYTTNINLSFTHSRLLKHKAGPNVPPGTFPIEGDLAESWTQPNETTYVFKLRKGVRWHNKPPVNGRELTADDVVYTVERFRTVLERRRRFAERVFTDALGLTYDEAASYAWPSFRYAITLLFPTWYGSWARGTYVGAPDQWELAGYSVGALATLLGALSLFRRERRRGTTPGIVRRNRPPQRHLLPPGEPRRPPRPQDPVGSGEGTDRRRRRSPAASRVRPGPAAGTGPPRGRPGRCRPGR